MKKLVPVFCAFILVFSLVSTQPAAGAEGVLVLAGLRIVPDPDLTDKAGGKPGTIRTSELIDRIVKNPQGHDLGWVSDLVFGRDGHIAYLMISSGESGDDQLIPVPFDRVLYGGHENWLVLSNMDKSRFEHAPSIQRNQWNRLEDPAFESEVFSYYGSRQDRTGRKDTSGAQ